MTHRVSWSLLAAACTAFLCLAGGPLAFGQQNERTEVMYWHAGSPLRLRVTWAENSFVAELNGKEILASQPGVSGSVDEWVKLDPILKVGENTLTFAGLHEASASKSSHAWRFDVSIESTATGRWTALKDFSAKGPDATAPSPRGLQYKLTVKITVSE
jgi:hypothetical protein